MSMVARLLAALVIGLIGSSASATPIIDQNQPATAMHVAAFYQPDLAQSFQQTHGNIDGAGILLYSGSGTTGTVTIALWNALPNQSGASMLASGSGTASVGVTASDWFDVFWSPVTITPGTTYYLVFTSTSNGFYIDGSAGNPYPNGETFANAGYAAFSSLDYTFRTYYDNAVSAVPEPGSLGLFGFGLAGILTLVLLRRRRQITA